jgi:predicted RNA-binding Zn ribbon-like protein
MPAVTGYYHFDSNETRREDVTGQVNFTSHMDAVVTVAVRLANALTPGAAHGRPYLPPGGRALPAAVTAALREARPDTRDVSAGEAAQFRTVAEDIRAVFDAVAAGRTDAAAGLVNAMLARTGARPHLDQHDGEPWHLHFHGAEDSLVTGWAAGCATGLAVVLGSDLHGRLGVCTAPRCDRVYVDTSRNATRRFCSTSCQNRVKTAAFRRKQARPDEAEPQPAQSQTARPQTARALIAQPKKISASA